MNTMTRTTNVATRYSVRLEMKAGPLRELLSVDLGRHGFDVHPGRGSGADVVIADDGHRLGRGRRLSVRVGAEIEVYGPDGTWCFPATELDRLADVLRIELDRVGEAA